MHRKRKVAINENRHEMGTRDLISQGWLHLKAGEWERANTYFNKAVELGEDPAPAFIGLLCANLIRVDKMFSIQRDEGETPLSFEKEEHLANYKVPLDNMTYYQLALGCANDEYRKKIIEYNNSIKRDEEYRLHKYWLAADMRVSRRLLELESSDDGNSLNKYIILNSKITSSSLIDIMDNYRYGGIYAARGDKKEAKWIYLEVLDELFGQTGTTIYSFLEDSKDLREVRAEALIIMLEAQFLIYEFDGQLKKVGSVAVRQASPDDLSKTRDDNQEIIIKAEMSQEVEDLFLESVANKDIFAEALQNIAPSSYNITMLRFEDRITSRVVRENMDSTEAYKDVEYKDGSLNLAVYRSNK